MEEYFNTIPKTVLCIIFLVYSSLVIFSHTDKEKCTTVFLNLTDGWDKYLVMNPKCKMPNLDPFNGEALKYFKPEKYESCTQKELLTYVDRNRNISTLFIKKDVLPLYTNSTVTCCYSNITRVTDNKITISPCRKFKKKVKLHTETVMVKCRRSKSKKHFYKNTHFAINPNKKGIPKIKNNRSLSVLIIGIDSISRLNFIRAMPKTYRYVETNDWIPLRGYNKIDDNTFPNLMAILSGNNYTTSFEECKPNSEGGLNSCFIIWNDFRDHGYKTAYAEDEPHMATFNFGKKGFIEEPTDFYLRPYMIASGKLKRVKKNGMTYCTGPVTSGERILNVAMDYAVTFKNHKSFGLFWMNTFSHNNLNQPTGMDEKVLEFLENLTNNGILESSIVIFLSDHGLRFGDVRTTFTGWLEERLPFVYISVPYWFKTVFNEEYNNLMNNVDKLTTPYDMHLTLQHVLLLSSSNYTFRPSTACPGCRSLFQKIPYDRSCEDAAIEEHWCTCNGYSRLDSNSPVAEKAARFVVDQIERIIFQQSKGKVNCSEFAVSTVLSSSKAVSYKNETYILIVFSTKPHAVFESTVLVGANFSLVGGISRIDWYKTHGYCTDNDYLKKFCYCS